MAVFGLDQIRADIWINEVIAAGNFTGIDLGTKNKHSSLILVADLTTNDSVIEVKLA